MKGSAAPERPIERGGRGEARRDATEWPRVPLKQVCEINPRRAPSIPVGDDDAVSFVPMPAVDADHGVIAQRLERPFQEVKKGYTYFENGDVIFAKITPCMQNGKHAVCRDLRHGFGFGSTEFHVLRPGTRVRAEWVHGFLRQPELLLEAAEHFTGAVGQQRLPEDYLGELEIPLPPLAEQERIAGRLTEQLGAVERARAAAAQRLAAAEALPAALLREVFDGPQASGWVTRTLGDLVRTPIRTGISKPGRPDSDKRCLTLSAVRGRTLLLDASKPAEVSEADAEGAWLRPGCFYVVRGNGNRELVGRGAFAPDPMPRPILFPDLLFQIDLGEQVDPSFFWCLWTSAIVRREIEERARTAAGIYKINTGNLNTLPLSLPDLPTQRRLAADLGEKLAAAEGVIARCREELAAIEVLPAALLRDAFGGGRESEAPEDA